ncbi:NAD(P)-dependent oxidoreductase [Xanthomonas theicola]|uniref:Flavin reductase n=1 Tax=Xanthomonas theicola TaxID=56464 RepID=A0A2S6ZAH9_9XANT|nr:NAD(P)H-binding protein [Xanthomonas theicola]PPT79289.1 flavin reductase [Xanthomonas theicola]QNH24118.1 NAD(P)H-binding protein [Xanthomonas theicola]
MRVAVLGATGATGRELVRQALERGHTVIAMARDPARIAGDHPNLMRKRVDVDDPKSLAAALDAETTLISALGTTKTARLGVLITGARAVLAAAPQRVIWLGAFGTGASARAAGWLTRGVLGIVLRRELADKVAADSAVLAAGGTVFHAGPLSNGPLSAARRTVGLEALPTRWFPAQISRATVAAAMLDEAESPRFANRIAVPLGS